MPSSTQYDKNSAAVNSLSLSVRSTRSLRLHPASIATYTCLVAFAASPLLQRTITHM
jgi:hypothetical protein